MEQIKIEMCLGTFFLQKVPRAYFCHKSIFCLMPWRTLRFTWIVNYFGVRRIERVWIIQDDCWLEFDSVCVSWQQTRYFLSSFPAADTSSASHFPPTPGFMRNPETNPLGAGARECAAKVYCGRESHVIIKNFWVESPMNLTKLFDISETHFPLLWNRKQRTGSYWQTHFPILWCFKSTDMGPGIC